jgi:hypothetical protein
LGFGNVSLNLRFAVVSMIILVPLCYVLLVRVGMAGGGIAWLLMNILTIPLYCRLVHKEFLPEAFIQWLCHDIGKAVIGSAVLVVVLPFWISIPTDRFAGGLRLTALWVFSNLVVAILLPAVRAWLVSRIAFFRS